MVGSFLLRGMLVGILAGVLCFGFLKVFGEPQVDRAIAFESQMDEAKTEAQAKADSDLGMANMPKAAEPELVTRPVQAGLGLLTGVVVYGAALGGLFALAFSLALGRMTTLGSRATAALLAVQGFVAVYLVPNLKYPANPPSVGEPDTIAMRTGLYFAIIALSVAAMIAAGMLRNRLVPRLGDWTATLIAAAAYVGAMIVVAAVLPGVNEVPETFPATVLWQFRLASIGSQALLWATLGLVFGLLAERVTESAPRAASRATNGLTAV